MRVIIAAFCVVLIGCGNPEWNSAAENHTCTNEQMIKVQEEFKWCTENTDYVKNYCYGAAIMRNCSKIIHRPTGDL